jgi:hypothetical protein
MKIALIVVAFMLFGCEVLPTSDASIPAIDSGSVVDSGISDAGTAFDSGVAASNDAGMDAGIFDSGTPLDSGIPLDSGVRDAGPYDDGGVKAAQCASTFGSFFTAAFGRVDGIVTAVVPPAYPCTLPNGDHVVIQVNVGDAGIGRLVVNVKSSFGDPNIRLGTFSFPLPAPAFELGWHPGLMLNYQTLGVHADAGFTSVNLNQASMRIYDAIEVGQPISIYATSSGGVLAASAHLIHRNGNNNDGALVLNPTSAIPTFMLFHFANQSF